MREKSQPALRYTQRSTADSYLQGDDVLKLTTIMQRVPPLLNMMSFNKGIVVLIVGIVAAHGDRALSDRPLQRHSNDVRSFRSSRL
jgi:hypothetical protein